MPPGQCPVGLMLGQLQASAAQTCGKCTPCAQGMPKLEALLREVAQFRATTVSTMYFLMPRMFTGASTMVRRQRSSQGCSHTSAQAGGKGSDTG